MTDLAKFATLAEAQAAADKAMPRRKRNRPYAGFSGAVNAWIVYVGNIFLMEDGTMYDHMRRRTIRS